MLFATVDQGWIFLVMLAAGAAVGVLWDALALLRRLLEAGFFLSLIADILLGLGSAAILIIAMVQANYGQPRAYMFVAAGLGAALYGIAVARPLHGGAAAGKSYHKSNISLKGKRRRAAN